MTVLNRSRLIHAGHVESGIARLRAQLADHILPVDVIDLLRAARLEERVQEGLQRADRQVGGGLVDLHHAIRPPSPPPIRPMACSGPFA